MSWLKQSSDKALFEELFWSRPEQKARAGKLLIVGGNSSSFAAPAQAYNAALKAGIGACRVALPDKLQKSLAKSFEQASFLPSTPSGSLARSALGELVDLADWADAILLAGDFGRNSETAMLLDSLMEKFRSPAIIAGDGLDYFLSPNSVLCDREGTLSIINFGKLQELAKKNAPQLSIKYSMSLHDLVNQLSTWTNQQPSLKIITKHDQYLVVAADGEVSTTKSADENNWQVELAAFAAVWWLQNQTKIFEAMTTAAFDYL